MTSLLSRIASLVGRRPRAATLAVLLALIALIGGAVAAGGSFKDDFTVPGIESQKAQDLLEQRFPAQSGTQATSSSAPRAPLARARHQRRARQDRGAAPRQRRRRSLPAGASEDGRTAFATVNYDQTAPISTRRRTSASKTPPPASSEPASTSPCPASRRRRRHRRLPDRRGDRPRHRRPAADRRAAQPARRAQRARRRLRRHRARLRRADVGRRRDRRPRPRSDARRHARPRRRHRLRAAARRPPAGGAARRPRAARGRSARQRHGRALRADRRRASSSSRSPACSSPASRSSAAPAWPPASSCSPARSCAWCCCPPASRAPAASCCRGASAVRTHPPRPRAPRARRGRPSGPASRSRPPAAVTLALAAPAAGLELGQPDDRNLTPDTTQRQAYDRLAEGFGAGVNGPLVVAVSCPTAAPTRRSTGSPTARSRPRGRRRRRARPQRGGRRRRHHRHAAPRPAGRRARARWSTACAPTAIPAALSGTGASAYVGGRTARYGDEAEKIASRIPLFAAAVVGLSLLLLLAAFRSWRISLLSAAFNLASIAAAYGVVALAFQTAGGRGAARRRAAAGRPLRAAVHVRDPVRAVD